MLLSARDAGAVAQVAALAAALRDDPRLETTLVASPPAFDLLAAAGEQPVSFALHGVICKDRCAFRYCLRKFLLVHQRFAAGNSGIRVRCGSNGCCHERRNEEH